MKRRFHLEAVIVFAIALLASAAVATTTYKPEAQKAGTNKAGTNKAGTNKAETSKAGTNKAAASPTQGANAAEKVSDAGVFTVTERDQMAAYYKKNRATFSSTKPIPPGIAKNLQLGKPLPPGIAKTRLPRGLESTLPARRDLIRYQVGPDVVAVDKKGTVKDIMRGVFNPS